MRTLLLFGVLVLLTPSGIAHFPPGPVTGCQTLGEMQYHDFLPPGAGTALPSPQDGNVFNCVNDTWTFDGVLDDNDAACQILKAHPDLTVAHSLLCLPIDTGVNRFLLDFDGELDHGAGGAFLAVASGDGVTWGAYACYGMIGHHGFVVHVSDATWGPVPYVITSDHSRTPPAPGPKGPRVDCGDLIIEPCGPGSAPGSCNPADSLQSCPVASWPPAAGVGANTCSASAPPGIDGVYGVIVGRTLYPGTGGHIWTT